MIYKFYLSADHPFRDFLIIILLIALIGVFVCLGAELASLLLNNELWALFIGGLFGSVLFITLMVLWEAKADARRRKKGKKESPKKTPKEEFVERISRIDPTKLKAAATNPKVYREIYKEIHGRIDWSTLTANDLDDIGEITEDLNERTIRTVTFPTGRILVFPDATPLDVVQDPMVAQFLIAHGANVNTAKLSYAANIAVAECLFAHGLRVSPNDGAAIVIAIQTNRLDVAEFLIDHGANVNGTNSEGKTALFFEVSPQFTKKLLEHGADKTITDKNGKKAIDYMKNPAIKKLLK